MGRASEEMIYRENQRRNERSRRTSIREIPDHLIRFGCSYVKLKGKKPIEKKWQDIVYTADSINSYIKSGRNYGVLCGYSSLVVIDGDCPEVCEIIEAEIEAGVLPKTFIVETPKKGRHYYFKIVDWSYGKIILGQYNDDGEFVRKNTGEILGAKDDGSCGYQIVGPTSIHPDTKTPYKVVSDEPIAEVSSQQIKGVLAEFLPKERDLKKMSKTSENESMPISKEVNALEAIYTEEFVLTKVEVWLKDPLVSRACKEHGNPFSLTQKGSLKSLNERFWAKYVSLTHNLIYEPSMNAFFMFNRESGLYEVKPSSAVREIVANEIEKLADKIGYPELKEKAKVNILRSIVDQMKGVSMKTGVFDHDKPYIHFNNGIVDLRVEGGDVNLSELRKPTALDYSKNKLQVDYDPNAKCSRFLDEYLKLALNKDDIKLLQKYAGLCIFGKNTIQKILIVTGVGGSGKSIFSNCIQGILGEVLVTELRTGHMHERFELYRYRGKKLLYGVDVQERFLQQKGAQVLKGLTGGDTFDTEKKGASDSFPMRGEFPVLLTSNSSLKIGLEKDAEAWLRRLLIVEFNKPVLKKIVKFHEILLEEEGSGILNWALEGFRKLIKEVSEHGEIVLTEVQRNRVEKLVSGSDSVRQFVEVCLKTSDSGSVTIGELKEAYYRYCQSKGFVPVSVKSLSHELADQIGEKYHRFESHSVGIGERGYRRIVFTDFAKSIGSSIRSKDEIKDMIDEVTD